MYRADLDGIPVLWEDGPGPLFGALVLGVGVAHETFRTVGVTHLVEHLVMAAQPRSHLDVNASVSATTTAFHAAGPREEVLSFLASIARTLADLPLDRLDNERRVLAAEGGFAEHPVICESAGWRYGLCGPGLLGTEGPGVAQLTAEHVRDHVRTHAVRCNAVVVLTGPPPQTLELGLPDGPPPPAPAVRPTGIETPGRIPSKGPLFALSLDHPAGTTPTAWNTGLRILAERLRDDLRHGRGLSYDIDWDAAPLGADRALTALWADGSPDDAAEVAKGLWEAARLLADRGPTQAELAHDRAAFDARLADGRLVADRLMASATSLLASGEAIDFAQRRAEHERLTSEDVAAVLAGALPSALLHVPEEVDGEVEGLPLRGTDESADPPLPGREFPGKLLRRRPRGLKVVLGEDGVSLHVGRSVTSVRWADVVGLERDPAGPRTLVRVDGRALPIFPEDLRHGADLVRLVEERVPQALWFDPAPER